VEWTSFYVEKEQQPDEEQRSKVEWTIYDFKKDQPRDPKERTSSNPEEGQPRDEEQSLLLEWTVPRGTKFGRLDRLKLLPREEESSSPGIVKGQSNSGMAKVATEAVGLNFADIFTVLGLYTAANLVRGASLSPFVPGLEFSGRILEDCSGTYQKGDRVLGFTRFGAYSEIVTVPPVFLLPLPETWTYSQGAAFLVQALTAWHGLVEIGGMPLLATENVEMDSSTSTTNKSTVARTPPFVVIVHSASGGVGLWASELAARRGGTVLGIVGDESKAIVFEDRIVSRLSPQSRIMIRGNERDFAERLASELWILHHGGSDTTASKAGESTPSLSTLAKEGFGADLVMESLGGKYFRASFEALNDGGSLVTFGSTTYSSPGRGGINLLRLIWRYLRRPRIDPGELVGRNLRLAGFNLIFLTERTAQLRSELSECVSCLSGKSVREDTDNEKLLLSLEKVTPPLIGETFDFRTQAVDALEALKSGKTVGKVVLVNGHAWDERESKDTSG
jgi:alcohol dehydrogenase